MLKLRNGKCARIHSLYASSLRNSLTVGLFEAEDAVVLAIVTEKKERKLRPNTAASSIFPNEKISLASLFFLT